MSGRVCPGCGWSMSSGHLGPLELDICLACGGVWFEGGELSAAAAAGPGAIRRMLDKMGLGPGASGLFPPSGTPCPACEAPLAAVEYPSMPGVRMCGCGACSGFWLNPTSLMRLAQSLERPAAPAPSRSAEVPNPGESVPGSGSPTPDRTIHPQRTRPVAAGATSEAGLAAGPEPQVRAASPSVPPAVASPRSAPETRVKKPDRKRGAPASDPAITAVVNEACPYCGQPNSEKARSCWACGKMLVGEALNPCPRCEGVMRRLESDGIVLGGCDGCGGLWLERGRLGAILFQSLELRARMMAQLKKQRTGRIKKLHQELVCPQCGLLMFATPMGMAVRDPVDTCPRCQAVYMDYELVEGFLLEK